MICCQWVNVNMICSQFCSNTIKAHKLNLFGGVFLFYL
jgi:hypothetical protein